MSEQKATVGRIVHYVSYGTPGGEFGSECRAAIVTGAEDPAGKAALAVLNPTGMFFNVCSHDEDMRLIAGTWHWPERD